MDIVRCVEAGAAKVAEDDSGVDAETDQGQQGSTHQPGHTKQGRGSVLAGPLYQEIC